MPRRHRDTLPDRRADALQPRAARPRKHGTTDLGALSRPSRSPRRRVAPSDSGQREPKWASTGSEAVVMTILDKEKCKPPADPAAQIFCRVEFNYVRAPGGAANTLSSNCATTCSASKHPDSTVFPPYRRPRSCRQMQPLPINAYYEPLRLAVSTGAPAREPVGSGKPTVSGCSRGEQRQLYDERRRIVLPQHGISGRVGLRDVRA
jgi:hypothetical protein